MVHVPFVVVAGFILTAAAAFQPALRLARGLRLVVLAALWAVILAAPFLVPPQQRLLRMIASVIAITVTLKLYDLHVGATSGVRPGFFRVAVFLWNPFCLVDRKCDLEPRPSRVDEFRRIAGGVAGLAVGAAAAVCVARVDWGRQSFAIEHAVKVVTFFLVLFPFTAIVAAVWRLAGGSGRDIMINPFAARTPADFWRRYNRPVHQYMEENVFRPIVGPRVARAWRGRFLAATLISFLVSAAAHEYVFAAPVGRVQGYQTAFFLVQGLAVGATARVRPRGWRVAPWVCVAFLFNLAAGVLFFASLHHVVPIYRHPPPLWDERPAPLPYPSPRSAWHQSGRSLIVGGSSPDPSPWPRAYASNPARPQTARGRRRAASQTPPPHPAPPPPPRAAPGTNQVTVPPKLTSSKHCTYALGPATRLAASCPSRGGAPAAGLQKAAAVACGIGPRYILKTGQAGAINLSR